MAEGEGNRLTWSPAETKCLISLWSEDHIRSQMESARNKHAFVKLEDGLKEAGYVRTVEQIRRKIRDLRSAFKKVKDNNNRSGRGRITCPFFEEIDLFLGSKEATEPGSLLESQADTDSPEDGDASEDEDGGSPRGPTPPPLLDSQDSSVLETSSSTDLDISGTSSEDRTENPSANKRKAAEQREGGKDGKGGKEDKNGKTGYIKKDKKKKTRLEIAFSGLEKSLSTLEDKKTDEWKAHDLQVMKLQQEHEKKVANDMMGQFMTMMGQVMATFTQSQRNTHPTPSFQPPHTYQNASSFQRPATSTFQVRSPAPSTSGFQHHAMNNPSYQNTSPFQSPATSTLQNVTSPGSPAPSTSGFQHHTMATPSFQPSATPTYQIRSPAPSTSSFQHPSASSNSFLNALTDTSGVEPTYTDL